MSHAGYYPGGKVMTMKVIFEKESYRLLGAQIIGYEGVYRENMVLTVFGILAGVGIGAFLHGKVIRTVEVDMMMFGRRIFFRSFLYSGLITLAFALLVNGMMYYRLKKIDMIESLKSVE